MGSSLAPLEPIASQGLLGLSPGQADMHPLEYVPSSTNVQPGQPRTGTNLLSWDQSGQNADR